MSLCTTLKELDVRKVKCVELGDIVCIPVLDLQKHNNLKQLILINTAVENMLLPEGEANKLWLHNLTITHHSLEQVVNFVTFYPDQEKLDVRKVKCAEHDDTVFIPVLDSQKHYLKRLVLDTISVESQLLPEGEDIITSLCLYNLTITNHSLEQIVKFMTFCPGLEELDVKDVKCVEHSDTGYIHVLD